MPQAHGSDPFSHKPQGSSGGKRRRKHSGKAKDIVKVASRLGERYGRRGTTDPFTTHIAMKEFITARQGLLHGELKLAMPKPDLAPRVFPGARTIIGQTEKRGLGIDE